MEYILFDFLWVAAVLPKAVQLLLLGVLLAVLLWKRVSSGGKLKLDLFASLLFVVSGIHVVSIFWHWLYEQHEYARVFAAMNTLAISLIAIGFYLYYKDAKLDMKHVNSAMHRNMIIIFCMYLLYLLLQEKGNFTFMPNLLCGEDWIGGQREYRFRGYLEYTNLVVSLCLFCYPFSVVYVKQRYGKKILLISQALWFIPIVATNSRTGIVFVGAITLFAAIFADHEQLVGLYFKHKKKVWVYGVMAVVVLLVLFHGQILDLVDMILNMRGGSTSTRFAVYERSINKMLSISPVIGLGIKDLIGEALPYGSHSTYLGMFYKTGILGGSVYMIAIVVAAVTAARKKVNSGTGLITKVVFFALLALWAFEDVDGTNWNVVMFMATYAVLFKNKSFSQWENSMNRDMATESSKRHLFLIDTTSQLMNAAALAKTEFEGIPCDVYYTPNVRQYAEKMAEENVFAAVYEVELVKDLLDRSSALKEALVRIKNALDIGKIEKNLPSDPMSYTRVLCSGVSLRKYEIYYAIKRNNPNVRFDLFEEGICEYYFLAKKPWSKVLFSYIFFGRYYADDCENLYVYSPEIVEVAWKKIKLKAITPVPEIPGLLQIVNRCYDYTPTELATGKYKCVFLEQKMDTEAESREQIALIRTIAETFGENELIVKLHPRTDPESYKGMFDCMKTSMPFEIIAMNEDVEDITFISCGSSTLLNFRLMLHKEPNIFLLGMMGDPEELKKHPYARMFYRVQAGCSKNNFYIPMSEEDFYHRLHAVRGQ